MRRVFKITGALKVWVKLVSIQLHVDIRLVEGEYSESDLH